MRNALVYLLFVATLLPAASQWGTIAYYRANRDYIARVLCENRDKPQLHCDGKCFLAKKLKATQDKQDQETTERVQNMPVLSLFCNDLTRFSFAPVAAPALEKPVFAYRLPAYFAPLAPVFHPPGFGC